MPLNFNVEPYFDDFDPNDNYHRILFKPGFAIQARELTQAQTIQQDQITKFADNIFSQNSPVTGGKVTTNLYCHYIKLQSTYLGASIDVSLFDGKIIQDATGLIVAKVITTVQSTSTEDASGDPNTLIVSYISGQKFSDGSVIYDRYSNEAVQAVVSNATGDSSVVSISQGVFYVASSYKRTDGTNISNGVFVQVNPQTIVLSKYSNTPSNRVGLNKWETINDYIDNPALLDPALGASNYQAPGADRYKITLTLESRSLDLGDDDGFIELLRIKDGVITKQVDGSVYSVIDDYMAKRTYDTNGDYLVNPFKLTPASNLDGDASKFDLGIGKGIAYVRGYRLENQSTLSLTGNRARTFDSLQNNDISIDYGNYFYVKSVKGSVTGSGPFAINTMATIDLHSVPLANIASSSTQSAYKSTLIGTAKIRDLEYSSGTGSNTATYIYKAAVCDITTNVISGNATTGSTSTDIHFYNNGLFSAKNDAYVGVYITIDSGSSVGDRRKIVSYDGSSHIATVDKAFSTTPTTSSKFSLRFDVKDLETIVSSNATFGIVSSADIDVSSKYNQLSSGDTILKDTGYPELLYRVGNSYVKTLSDTSYETKKVFVNQSVTTTSGGVSCVIQFESSDTSVLDFLGRVSSPLTEDEVLDYYTVFVRTKGSNSGLTNGQILDFTDAARTVTVDASRNSVTFFDGTGLVSTGGFTVDIIAKVNVTNANSNRILRYKNLITASQTVASNTGGTVVNTNTYVGLADGQVYIKNAGLVSPGNKQSLYISDVKKLVKIIDTGSSVTLPTVSMLSTSSYDVTSYYTINSGQTDNYYDHAYITLRPGAPKAKGNLLVLVNYYDHTTGSGDGYFSVNSYISPEVYAEIPSYTSTSGTIYSLRDCLDFRPSRKNADSDFEFNYTSAGSGYYLPNNLTQFTTDYSFYLARKDLLILTKDRTFAFIEGVPSLNPKPPAQPDGSLVISNLNLDPYTGYVPGENPPGSLPNLSIETVQHKRWTMQDISDLQKRINNIEYYTALNTLEQSAASTQVPDVNGLNRFKNGILVDDFSSFSTADTSNNDWSAAINKRTRQLTASQIISNFTLQNPTVLQTIGQASHSGFSVNTVDKTTNMFSLPYTSVSLVSQPLASNTINLNPFAVTINEGILYLNPPMDNWVDNTKAPDLLIVDPSLQVFQQSDKLNVLSSGDWKTVPGTEHSTTKIQKSPSHSVENHGAFNGPFGTQVGYTETTTSTTTSTYGNKSQENVLGYYQNINNTYNLNNNYITDVSILPYIRSQELLIKAKGLLTNTPITASFDGKIVNDYMSAPDIIELTGVTGIFRENDIIGYTDIDNIFHPIATVIHVYAYPTASTRPGTGIYTTQQFIPAGSVRLSVVGNFHSSYYDGITTSSNPTIKSVKYGPSGNITSHPASGLTSHPNVISTSCKGSISTVGGNFTDVSGNPITYYSVKPSSTFGSFSTKYAVWGSAKGTGSLPLGKFTITTPTTQTYFLRYAANYSGVGSSGYIKIYNGSNTLIQTITLSVTKYTDVSVPLTAGTNYIEFYCNSTSTTEKHAYISAALSTLAWTGNQNTYKTKGTIITNTSNLKGASVPLLAGTEITMPGKAEGEPGGLYYVGATSVALNGISREENDYYKDARIIFTTTYVTKEKTTTKSFSSTITAYNGTNCVCTLATPVDLSIGFNSITNSDITSTYSIQGTHNNYTAGIIAGGLAKLSTDESGTFIGVFRIPADTFKSGDRVFKIDNRTSDADPDSATTFAQATFTASGLSTKSQALNFGSSVSGAASTFSQTNTVTNQLLSTNTVIKKTYTPYDPIAQSFLIEKDNYPNGVFLESVDFFFRTKPSEDVPITLTVVPTINGYPSGQTLDHSTVTLHTSDVNVLANGLTPHYLDPTATTTFKFHVPVYIQPGLMYAFILKTASTDYTIYLAQQNATAYPSTVKANYTDANPTVITKIGGVPGIGGLFESQNGITWTADQTKTLMMTVKRCKFDTTSIPSILFSIPQGLPQRKTTSGDIRYILDPDNVSSTSNQQMGSDVLCDAFNVTTTDFTPSGTNVRYFYNSVLDDGNLPIGPTPVSPGKYGCPTPEDIHLSDGLGERVLLANSSTSFTMEVLLSSADDAVSPVVSDDGLTLFNVQYNINNLPLSNNLIILTNGGEGYTTGTPAANVVISAPDVAGGTQALASANVVGGIIDSIYFTNTGSGYLNTPTVTITGANTTPAVATCLSELSPHGGNAKCKYFTKKVVMAAGNDSQDLRMFYTAYRPIGTNIYVFYKILNSNDSTKFDDNAWQLMTTVGQNKNVYSTTRSDLYEFEAAPGANGVADNYVKYTNINEQVYDSFIQFAFKIVLTTNDKTTVPFLTNIRSLALPSGTGI
jgi:hypothetical protein